MFENWICSDGHQEQQLVNTQGPTCHHGGSAHGANTSSWLFLVANLKDELPVRMDHQAEETSMRKVSLVYIIVAKVLSFGGVRSAF